MKAATLCSQAARNVVVFFVSFVVLHGILSLGGVDLDTVGDPQLDRELQTYHEFLAFKVPANWIVPPFLFVSATLIAWLDSRRMERKRAAKAG